MFFDSHCHVQFEAYRDDRDEVVKRTLAEGVFLLSVGTQMQTSEEAIAIANQYDGVWASVGLHPNHLAPQMYFDEQELKKENPEAKFTPTEVFDAERYRKLATHPKCVAIGECGLDYYRLPEHLNREETIETQKQTVRAHFDLADELNLPVIVHCRDAYADQLVIIKEYVSAGKLKRRGVIHCFAGTLEEAQSFIDQGFLLGFTGVVTFPPKKSGPIFDGLSESQNVIKHIPLEYLLIETDAPYLTPNPHRGERNEPLYVKFVAEKMAALKNCSVEEVERITFENAQKLFGF